MQEITVPVWDGNNTATIIGERIFAAVAETIALKNGENLVFDDQFTGGTVDLSKWNPVGTVTQAGGILSSNGTGSLNSGGLASDNTQVVVATDNDQLELSCKLTDVSSDFIIFGFRASATLNALGTFGKGMFFLDVYKQIGE